MFNRSIRFRFNTHQWMKFLNYVVSRRNCRWVYHLHLGRGRSKLLNLCLIPIVISTIKICSIQIHLQVQLLPWNRPRSSYRLEGNLNISLLFFVMYVKRSDLHIAIFYSSNPIDSQRFTCIRLKYCRWDVRHHTISQSLSPISTMLNKNTVKPEPKETTF